MNNEINQMTKRIVIFASGSGTNAQNIIRHFKSSPIADVVLVLTNNERAKVLERAQNENIKSLYFHKDDLYKPDGVLKVLKEVAPDIIVLAGFLLKFPDFILKEYPNKVVNIHPALLPKYGGKGMYGAHVHEAVIANKESETGMTIHFVNEHYDEGAIILQAFTPVASDDTAKDVARKVQELEYRYFPTVIEQLLTTESNG